MTTEAQGFKKFTSAHNKLNASTTLSLDADMAVKATTERAQIGQAGGLQLNPTAGTFGEVTQKSTTNPRNLQVGLKFLF